VVGAWIGAVENLMVFAGGVDGRGAGQLGLGRIAAVAGGRRHRRWRHVVEEAVVFVEIDDQDRLAPAVGIGSQASSTRAM
jgi:hypothetical protein